MRVEGRSAGEEGRRHRAHTPKPQGRVADAQRREEDAERAAGWALCGPRPRVGWEGPLTAGGTVSSGGRQRRA